METGSVLTHFGVRTEREILGIFNFKGNLENVGVFLCFFNVDLAFPARSLLTIVHHFLSMLGFAEAMI